MIVQAEAHDPQVAAHCTVGPDAGAAALSATIWTADDDPQLGHPSMPTPLARPRSRATLPEREGIFA
jgi:hypothetical protein